MLKILLITCALLVPLAQLDAQELSVRTSVGVALSGPVLGVSLTVMFSEKYSARYIGFDSDMLQAQVHYQPSVSENKSYIFGVGRIGETTYVRGAVGKKLKKGSCVLNGDLGFNIPIDQQASNVEGLGALVGATEAVSLLILVGVGVHYEF